MKRILGIVLILTAAALFAYGIVQATVLFTHQGRFTKPTVETLSVSPVNWNASTGSQVFTVTNAGNVVLNNVQPTTILVCSNSVWPFAWSPALPVNISAGGSATFTLSVQPTAADPGGAYCDVTNAWNADTSGPPPLP